MASSIPRFIVGGPAYRETVHVRHMGSVVALAQASIVMSRAGEAIADMVGLDYRHSSALPQIRCIMLRDMIADWGIKWFVSVDSDTTFNAGHLLAELHQVTGQTAIGLAPVRQGGTDGVVNLNLTSDDERRIAPRPCADPVRMVGDELARVLEGDRHIESGGFGVAVFNLDWYRSTWPLPSPEHCSIDTGEDIEHCMSVRKRGGIIKALRIQTDHFAHGESTLR